MKEWKSQEIWFVEGLAQVGVDYFLQAMINELAAIKRSEETLPIMAGVTCKRLISCWGKIGRR